MLRAFRPRVAFAAFLCALPLPAFATGQVLPVAVSASAVDSDPAITTKDFQGHKAWSIIWHRDAAGRALRIGLIEDLRLPYRDYPREMLDFAHDDGSDDPAEQRLELPGRAEAIWGREVFWLLMSERAVLVPDAARPEAAAAAAKLPRSEMRRTCAVFTADPAPRTGTLVGSFCRDLVPGTKVDAATARQWLEELELRIPAPAP